MPTVLKTRREIESMRHCGTVGRAILEKLRQRCGVGVSTASLDALAAEELGKVGGVGLSLNYPTYKAGHGFPGHLCISVNEEVVHGIPSSRKLVEGDIVTLDLALRVAGYCTDMAITIGIGTIDAKKQRLLDVTRQTLDLAIANMKVGRKWTDIARLMQYNVEKNGFSVIREFVGHGIGRSMHEDPKVPNFVTAEQLRGDFKLRPGMTLAVEPMVVTGHRDVTLLPDGWTVISSDGQPAAHFEQTVAITEDGPDVLTDAHQPVAVAAGY